MQNPDGHALHGAVANITLGLACESEDGGNHPDLLVAVETASMATTREHLTHAPRQPDRDEILKLLEIKDESLRASDLHYS